MDAIRHSLDDRALGKALRNLASLITGFNLQLLGTTIFPNLAADARTYDFAHVSLGPVMVFVYPSRCGLYRWHLAAGAGGVWCHDIRHRDARVSESGQYTPSVHATLFQLKPIDYYTQAWVMMRMCGAAAEIAFAKNMRGAHSYVDMTNVLALFEPARSFGVRLGFLDETQLDRRLEAITRCIHPRA